MFAFLCAQAAAGQTHTLLLDATALDVGAPATEHHVTDARRDPFRPIDVPAPPAPILAAQRFSLDQLDIVAVILGHPEPYAMAMDPEGGGHILTVGSYVGPRWGKVVAIDRQGVLVVEEFATPSDEIRVHETRIDLRAP